MCSVMSNSLLPYGLWSARLLCPWDFSRHEHWSGFLFPSPGDLTNPGIKSTFPAFLVDSLPLELLALPNYTFCPDQISLLQFNIVALFFQQKDKKVFLLTFNNILLNLSLSSVQSLSCVRLFVTLWTVAPQASLSILNSQILLKLMSIKTVMPSNLLILCHPLLLPPSIFPSIRVFSIESVLCIRCAKYWSFSFSISPSNEYSGLISFRTDCLDLLAVQETLKSLLQHHSSKAFITTWRIKEILV